MNEIVKGLLHYLFNRKYIGERHIPEDRALKPRLKKMSKKEQKEFYKYYHDLINEAIILRVKKKTGKGQDWHISLNPKSTKTIKVIELER